MTNHFETTTLLKIKLNCQKEFLNKLPTFEKNHYELKFKLNKTKGQTLTPIWTNSNTIKWINKYTTDYSSSISSQISSNKTKSDQQISMKYYFCHQNTSFIYKLQLTNKVSAFYINESNGDIYLNQTRLMSDISKQRSFPEQVKLNLCCLLQMNNTRFLVTTNLTLKNDQSLTTMTTKRKFIKTRTIHIPISLIALNRRRNEPFKLFNLKKYFNTSFYLQPIMTNYDVIYSMPNDTWIYLSSKVYRQFTDWSLFRQRSIGFNHRFFVHFSHEPQQEMTIELNINFIDDINDNSNDPELFYNEETPLLVVNITKHDIGSNNMIVYDFKKSLNHKIDQNEVFIDTTIVMNNNILLVDNGIIYLNKNNLKEHFNGHKNTFLDFTFNYLSNDLTIFRIKVNLIDLKETSIQNEDNTKKETIFISKYSKETVIYRMETMKYYQNIKVRVTNERYTNSIEIKNDGGIIKLILNNNLLEIDNDPFEIEVYSKQNKILCLQVYFIERINFGFENNYFFIKPNENKSPIGSLNLITEQYSSKIKTKQLKTSASLHILNNETICIDYSNNYCELSSIPFTASFNNGIINLYTDNNSFLIESNCQSIQFSLSLTLNFTNGIQRRIKTNLIFLTDPKDVIKKELSKLQSIYDLTIDLKNQQGEINVYNVLSTRIADFMKLKSEFLTMNVNLYSNSLAEFNYNTKTGE
jgi:hypothetical protein